jgi:DNA repair exonuclease SbcCD nuclease subunit
MKLLVTSDWQTDFANLDNCEICLDHLLRMIKKHEPDATVINGDLKDPYNPIDTRIAKFWVRAVRLITKYCPVLINKGNHDRISQSSDSKDWLDILRAAGAKTASNPRAIKAGDGVCFFLPFTKDKEEEKMWAEQLRQSWMLYPEGTPTVLFFHTELLGASLGNGERLAEGNKPESLHMDRYDLCLGGHLHEFQVVRDWVYYTGSPFCQDWGEVNQKKGFTLVNLIRGYEPDVKFITGKVPRWYDADWLEKNEHEPEDGAYVRAKVTVTSKKIMDTLKAEELRFIKKYGTKIHLYVKPELKQSDEKIILLEGKTDKEKIEQYVAHTIAGDSRWSAERGVGYLTGRLVGSGQISPKCEIRFIKTTGNNVLSFQSVTIPYIKQGLVLLKGKNIDWPKRSNGAGKSNVLSLLPVALFGKTLKEQENDDWSNDHIDEPSLIKTKLRVDGKVIEVERTRPHSLRFIIDGTDQSSGLTGKRKKETQGMIEDAIGYDMDMLLNAVYIDQTVVNSFVFGKQSLRMAIVNKILRLERFDVAKELVLQDIRINEKESYTEESKYIMLDAHLGVVQDQIEELLGQKEVEWEKKLKDITKEVRRLVDHKAALAGSESALEEAQQNADDLQAEYERLRSKKAELSVTAVQLEARWVKVNKLISEGRCSNCGQEVEKSAERERTVLGNKLQGVVKELAAMEKEVSVAKELMEKRQKEIKRHKDNMLEVEYDLRVARKEQEQIQKAAEQEQERNKKVLDKIKTYKEDLIKTKKELKATKVRIIELSVARELQEYAKRAFSRSGMPMYLSQQMCPVLNKAAEEYSEIFTEGKIKLQFYVQDGEFVVSTVNVSGSATSKGQSVGEAAMAGIICAFSLREVMPKTNLLIMDEPGAGLDPEGSKQFAKGLIRLKDRFETIIVTTHSPGIEAVLSGEKIWTVEKTDRISRLIR